MAPAERASCVAEEATARQVSWGIVIASTVGPEYVRPAVETPARYKESDAWKLSQPVTTCPAATGGRGY